MPELHIKGHILRLIARNESMWDDEIATAVLRDYGLSGGYWHGTVRLTLTDLFSSGLLDEVDVRVAEDAGREGGTPQLRFKFSVNDFGAERMAQTGLLEVAR